MCGSSVFLGSMVVGLVGMWMIWYLLLNGIIFGFYGCLWCVKILIWWFSCVSWCVIWCM